MSWDLAVLAAVFALQIFYCARCRALSREDDGAVLEELFDVFEQDLVERTRRGHTPDWLSYADEADRVSEGRSDTLRIYATAALATGIGGTMLTLAVNLFLAGAPEVT